MKYSNLVKMYALLTLSVILIPHLYFFVQFTKLGLFNFSNRDVLLKQNMLVSEINNGNEFNFLMKDLTSLNHRAFAQRFKSLAEKMNFIENNEPELLLSADYKKLEKEIDRYTFRLLSFADVASVIMVVRNKLDDFKTISNKNNWKMLNKITTRLIKKMKTRESYNVSWLSLFVKYVQQDISIMKNITKASLLKSSKKNIIYEYLNDISIESKKLSNHILYIKKLISKYETYQKSSQAWLSKSRPLIEERILKLKNTTKHFSYTFVGIIVFLILSLISCAIIFKLERRVNNQNFENYFVDLVNNLFKSKRVFHKEFSNNFKKKLDEIYALILRKKCFNDIFQKSLPFGFALFDENLKIVWGNELFTDYFRLESIKETYHQKTWNYFRNLTNIEDENDPVLEAIQNELSLVHEIRVKNGQKEMTKPYEMYVSSHEIDNKKWVVVYLYSLTGQEQLVSSQSESIVKPLSKTLNLMNNQKLNGDAYKEVLTSFKEIKLEKIFLNLDSYYQKTEAQKFELLKEIDRLEKNVAGKNKVVSNLAEKISQNIAYNKDMIKTLDDHKSEIINIFSGRTTVSKWVNYYDKKIDSLLNLLGGNYNSLNHLLEQVSTFKKSVGNIKSNEKDLKTVLTGIKNVKMKVRQAVDQIIVFDKTNYEDVEKLNINSNKIKLAVKELETQLNQLDNFIRQYNIHLSKINLIFSDSHQSLDQNELSLQGQQVKSNWIEERKNLKEHFKIYNEGFDSNEKHIIENLKKFVSFCKLSFTNNKDSMGFIGHSFEEDKRNHLEMEPLSQSSSALIQLSKRDDSKSISS